MTAALQRVYWVLEALWLSARPATKLDREPERWLILGYAAIGDLVFLLPLLEALRRRYPRARMSFLCTATPITAELVPATGLVDEIIAPQIDWPNVTLSERRRFARELRERRFDAALLNLSAPAHFFQTALAAIPLRVGHCTALAPPPHLRGPRAWLWKAKRAVVLGELSRRWLLTHKAWVEPNGEHMARRNLRLLEALGEPAPTPTPRPRIPLPPAARQRAAELLPPAPGVKRVAMHLGEPRNPYFKIWPPERFGRLCRRLEENDGVECVFVGGPGEGENVAAARRAAGREVLSLAGSCSLLESLAAIAGCELLISNDTGLAKAAMALGVPTATIWGPSRPDELGILWEPEKHIEIRTELPCQPCIHLAMAHARAGVDYTSCGHHACLRDLGIERVAAALRRKYAFLGG